MKDDDTNPDCFGRTIPAPPPAFHESLDDDYSALLGQISQRPAPFPIEPMTDE